MPEAICFNQSCLSRSICKRARPKPIGRKYTVGSFIVLEGNSRCEAYIEMRPKDGLQREGKENTKRDDETG